MTKQLNVGIIGVGGIAKAHMPGWAASTHAQVVAGCDVDQAALVAWGEKHEIKQLTTDADILFNDPNIDIIDVCVPNRYHAPLTIAALEAGKHVLCEKPLAITPAEVQQMIAARDQAGKLLMTAQHFRFEGAAQAMKAEIDTGVLGDVYHARAWFLRRAWLPLRPGFALKENSGGGVALDVGVHILDLALWLMGNPQPVSVSGVARTELAHQPDSFSLWHGGDIPETFDLDEFTAAFVRFANGSTLTLEASWLLHHDVNGETVEVWLYGTEGGCHYPSATFLASNGQTQQHYKRTLQLVDNALRPHTQECIDFAQAIVEGAPSPVPAEQSLQVIQILDGIYRSQSAGREIWLDE